MNRYFNYEVEIPPLNSWNSSLGRNSSPVGKHCSNHTKFLHLNSIHSSMYVGMCFHLYIFFTMFCVHSFFVFLFIMLIWSQTVVSQHFSKNDNRGWLTKWPPRSFANPRWHGPRLCLHRSAIVPLCFHLLQFSLMVGLLHAMAFMVFLLVGWVIWNNKPSPLPAVSTLSPPGENFRFLN